MVLAEWKKLVEEEVASNMFPNEAGLTYARPYSELNRCPFDCLLFGKSDTFLLDIESEEKTQMHAAISLYLIATLRSCIIFERPPGKSISNQTCLNLNLSAVCCFVFVMRHILI